jgi:DNA helicase HerA-like ATPase
VGHLIRGKDIGKRDAHLLDWRRKQMSVVDIHALHDRAKRFVVGAVLKRMFEEKESLGTARPLVFVVLDELNKYAPREGSSPIKEVLLDVSERGRSLGSCSWARSRRPPRWRAASWRTPRCGWWSRLDVAEAERPGSFLTSAGRGRAGILKPGTMVVLQPEIPAPLLVRFPFPAWATRKSEVKEKATADPFAGFRGE